MYSYTRESWEVYSVETGEILESFSGSSDADASGSSNSGTDSVQFSEDDQWVVAKDYDGSEMRIELPASFRVSEQELALICVYRDGREDRKDLVWARAGFEYMPEDDQKEMLERALTRARKIQRRLAEGPKS